MWFTLAAGNASQGYLKNGRHLAWQKDNTPATSTEIKE